MDIQPTPLQAKQLTQLRMLDEQCVECNNLPLEEMLCRGMRLDYNKLSSDTYGRPVLTSQMCNKLRRVRFKQVVKRRLDASCIPVRFIKQWEAEFGQQLAFNVTVTDDGLSIDDCLLPNTLTDLFTPALQEAVWTAMLNTIYGGYSARSILIPVLLDQYELWNSFLTHFGDAVTFLALMRFDLGQCPAYKADYLLELVRYRQSHGLTTLITVGDKPKPRTEGEVALYAEMQSWDTFNSLVAA